MVKNIKNIPLCDRPYEKLENLGEKNLTNSELLAIVIKNGTKEKTCIDIAREILNSNNKIENISDLEYLTMLSRRELEKFSGIGRVKAIEIKAIIELASRIAELKFKVKRKITAPVDAYEILKEVYMGKKQEEMRTILLDRAGNIISIINNYIGNISGINISVKEVLSEPLKQMATSIIIVHNHPSGNLNPSKEDILFTKKIMEYSKLFDIEVLDHIIVSNTSYLSMKNKGYI